MIAQLERKNNHLQIPPANIEAEENVLGGLLFDQNAWQRIESILTPEMFAIQAHQTIFKMMTALIKEGRKIDLMTLCDKLIAKGKLEEVGGQFKLAQLVDRTVSAVNIDEHAKLIAEKYFKREGLRHINELEQIFYDDGFKADQALNELLVSLDYLQRLIGTDYKSPKDKLIESVKRISAIEDPIQQWFEWDKLAKETSKSKKELINLALAIESNHPLEILKAAEFCQLEFVESDWLVEGLLSLGTCSLLAAESKTGKSLWHYDLAYHVATGEDWGDFSVPRALPTYIIQTDEPAQECKKRLLYRGIDQLDNVRISTAFKPGQLAQLKRRLIDFKPKLIIMDSLTSINRFSGFSVNDAQFAYFMYELKELASELGAHLLLIHHTNKNPVELGLDKIAGTYGIPAAVSDIFLFHRPKGLGDFARVLTRAGSRTAPRANWRLELNLEDNSWEWEGPCSLDGEPDILEAKAEETAKSSKEEIINHLKSSPGKGYEARELSLSLGISLGRCRGLCGELTNSRVIARRLSKTNKRAFVYYYPDRTTTPGNIEECTTLSDRSDRVDHPPRSLPEHTCFSTVSGLSDRSDRENKKIFSGADQLPEKKFPENPITPITSSRNPLPDINTGSDRVESQPDHFDHFCHKNQPNCHSGLNKTSETVNGPVENSVVQKSEETGNLTLGKIPIAFAGGLIENVIDGTKTQSRRAWKETHAEKFLNAYERGQRIFPAFNRSPRNKGEVKAWIVLTALPFQQKLSEMSLADVQADDPTCPTVEFFINKHFGGENLTVWVLNFKLVGKVEGNPEEFTPENIQDIADFLELCPSREVFYQVQGAASREALRVASLLLAKSTKERLTSWLRPEVPEEYEQPSLIQLPPNPEDSKYGDYWE